MVNQIEYKLSSMQMQLKELNNFTLLPTNGEHCLASNDSQV